MPRQEPETFYVNKPRVMCDGGEGALGHPRIFLQIDRSGFVDCGYCDRKFILAHGPADHRADHADAHSHEKA